MPPLDAVVHLPAGTYRLGEPGEERDVTLARGYASIAATVNFISRQPRVFAETLGKMMWWCGEDKIIYGGESPIWHPQWALEEFWNFELPELGGNLARLHGIDVEAKQAELGVPA